LKSYLYISWVWLLLLSQVRGFISGWNGISPAIPVLTVFAMPVILATQEADGEDHGSRPGQANVHNTPS
jgi:hypothetical protein